MNAHLTLHQLEREVEASRAKLAGDLSVLSSPATYSEFTSDLKSEALEAKDALIEEARTRVQSTFESVIDEVKARAAANPAAALAIGAGIAWRLIQRPPIASFLVGAGLYSLFNTKASPPAQRTTEGYLSQAKERLGEQASELAGRVKERASALGETAVEKASGVVDDIQEQALAMKETVVERASSFIGETVDRVEDLSAEVQSSLRRNGLELVSKSANKLQGSIKAADLATPRAAAQVEHLKPPHHVGAQDARDRILLGAAGVAVLAALSFAWQRRTNEAASADS